MAALQATAVTNAAQMQDQTKLFKEKAALNEDVLVSIKDQKQRLCSTLKLEVETKKKLEVEQSSILSERKKMLKGEDHLLDNALIGTYACYKLLIFMALPLTSLQFGNIGTLR